MSDIQDEAYSELCDENARLKELVESWKSGHFIAALHRDLAQDRVKRLEEALQRQENAMIGKEAELERLRALCSRAAEALHWDNPLDHAELIIELRKAAQ
jgi:hypothetical protein